VVGLKLPTLERKNPKTIPKEKKGQRHESLKEGVLSFIPKKKEILYSSRAHTAARQGKAKQ